MNINKLMNSMFYTQDVIKEFTKYSEKLDKYFDSDFNKTRHQELYIYYIELRDNLKELAIKHKVVKK